LTAYSAVVASRDAPVAMVTGLKRSREFRVPPALILDNQRGQRRQDAEQVKRPMLIDAKLSREYCQL
jgi:hypothetical protein